MTTCKTSPAALKIFREKLRAISDQLLEPPPTVDIEQWCEDTVYLSGAEPGPYSLSRTPYIKEIIENFISPNRYSQRVVVMKCAQSGLTTAMLAAQLFFLSEDPSTILYVTSGESAANEFSTMRLDPCINHSKKLGSLVTSPRAKGGQNKILFKKVPGGGIRMTGANSGAKLRMSDARILVLDEVDAFPKMLKGEGSPLPIAEKRALTYKSSKHIWLASTPTIHNYSLIERQYLAGDMRVWEFKCPLCNGEYQDMEWGGLSENFGIKWMLDLSDIFYLCKHCGGHIPETMKLQMLTNGRWRATNPPKEDGTGGEYPSYHINGIMSPWIGWKDDLVKPFLKVKDRADQLVDWVTLTLGSPFEDLSSKITPGDIAGHVHSYGEGIEVPDGVGVLVCGVDINGSKGGWLQADVWGVGLGEEMWLISANTIAGSPTEPDVWEQLKYVMTRPYKTSTGMMKISRTVIDYGYLGSVVAKHCAEFRAQGIDCHPVRGSSNRVNREIWKLGNPTDNGVPTGNVAGSEIKKILLGHLKNVTIQGPSYIHFYAGVPQQVLDEIATSEEWTRTYRKGGYEDEEWKQKGRNESLDTFCYAFACYWSKGERFRKVELPDLVANRSTQEPQKIPEQPPQQPPTQGHSHQKKALRFG